MKHFSKEVVSGIRLCLSLIAVLLFFFCTVYDDTKLKTLEHTSDGSVDIDSSSSPIEDTGGVPFFDSSTMDVNVDTQPLEEDSSVGDGDDSDTKEPPDIDSGSKEDNCPDDPDKTEPGECGCGVADTDTDEDGLLDCNDPAPYGWQRRLTLDSSQVDATLTDFPLLVRLTDDHLQSSAAADRNDIHFRAADQTSLLDFEIESYDASSGTLIAWVRIPTLNAGTDGALYLAYGDGQGDRSNAVGVWSKYHYVWHMSQNPGLGTGSIKDATDRADGTPHGNMTSANRVAAVAGYGISFDGDDDEISFTNDLTGEVASTISAWVKQLPDSSDNGSAVISFGNDTKNQARFLVSWASTNGLTRVGFYNNDISGVELTNDVWCHLVWTWNGSKSRLYVDGVLASGPTAHTGADTAGETGMIGNTTFSVERFLSGQLDEVRVATIVRSSAWISAEYRNQVPDSMFIKDIDAAEPMDSP